MLLLGKWREGREVRGVEIGGIEEERREENKDAESVVAWKERN